jgi:hypothetical protein
MSEQTKVGRALAVIGLIGSLGLVAFEIRANTNAVVSQTLQSLAEQQTDLSLLGVENPELREAYGLASDDQVDDLTYEQVQLLTWFYTGVMRITENRYRQYQLGTLSAEALSQLGAKGSLFRNPFFAVFWPTQEGMHSADFTTYVQQELLPLGDEPPRPQIR